MLEEMTRRAAAAFALAVTACGGGSPRQPLYAAGDDKDDGHGLLARASSRLLTDNESVPDPFAPQRSRIDAAYGGSIYGGDAYGMYGGDAYGGAAYAAYTPAPWGYPSVNRMPTYTQKAGLESAIEGTITWRGAMPAVTTRCGTIEPLRVSSARTVGGVLVYIERVNIGRTLPHGPGEQHVAIVPPGA